MPCTDADIDVFGTPVDCTEPGFYTRSAKAAMRVYGNKAVIFQRQGGFLLCPTLSDFHYGHGKTCENQTLYLDDDLDPGGMFLKGPDAAAEYITSTASESRYYLFLGMWLEHTYINPFISLDK